MTTANLYLVSATSGTVSTPNNALGNTPSTWTTDANTNTSWTERWRLDTIAGSYSATGTQTVTIRVRKGSNTGNPTVDSIRLYQGSTDLGLISTGSTSVTSTTGQDIACTFDGALLTGLANVDIEVVTTGVGGTSGARNCVAMAMATWAVNYTSAAISLTAAAASSATSGSTGALTQTHVLAAAAEASATAASASALTQVQDLTAASLSIDTAASTAALDQVHVLGADSIASDTAADAVEIEIPGQQRLYYSVFADGVTEPTGPEVVSGLSWADCVAAGNAPARPTDGEQSFDEVTGLDPNDYRCAFVISDGTNYSNVAVSAVETVSAGTVNLTAAAEVSATSVSTAALTQVHALAAASETTATAASAPALSQAHVLEAAAETSSTATSTASVTQTHALAAASETSATAASTGALSQVHAIGAANAASDTAASTGALTQAHQLISAAETSATAASAPAVTQTHALAADNAASDTALSDPSLPLAGVLQAANAVTETSTSTPALTQEHGLTAAAAQSATAAAAPALTQVHALAAGPAQSDTALQAVGVTVQSDLVAANATSTTQAESPAVTQVHELGASNAASATVTTAPSIQIVLPGNPTYVQRLGISMLDRNKAATVTIFMMDSTDHLSGKIGLTLSLSLSKAGGAFSPITRDVLEVGIGAYLVSLTDADTDTAGALILRATATGADDGLLIADVSEDVDLDVAPQKAMRLMLAALAGQGAGFGTSLETFKNVAGDKTRFTSTVDAVGNRIVTLGDLS